jgi:nitroreductase
MEILDLSPDELLSTTRTVRKRLDLHRPVEREVIEACVALAQQAPSGSNQQGFHFVVVTDPDRRRALGELFRRGLDIYRTLPIAVHNLTYTDPGQQRSAAPIIDALEYLAERVEHVPVHVFPCFEGPLDGIRPEFMGGLMGSVIPAAWSFMLAARSRALGTCWTNMHTFFNDEADAIIELPDGVTQIANILTAYTLGTDFRPATRRPLTEILHWDRW